MWWYHFKFQCNLNFILNVKAFYNTIMNYLHSLCVFFCVTVFNNIFVSQHMILYSAQAILSMYSKSSSWCVSGTRLVSSQICCRWYAMGPRSNGCDCVSWAGCRLSQCLYRSACIHAHTVCAPEGVMSPIKNAIHSELGNGKGDSITQHQAVQ